MIVDSSALPSRIYLLHCVLVRRFFHVDLDGCRPPAPASTSPHNDMPHSIAAEHKSTTLRTFVLSDACCTDTAADKSKTVMYVNTGLHDGTPSTTPPPRLEQLSSSFAEVGSKRPFLDSS